MKLTLSLTLALFGPIGLLSACSAEPVESSEEITVLKAKNSPPVQVAGNSNSPAEDAASSPVPAEPPVVSPAPATTPTPGSPTCIGFGPQVKMPYYINKPPLMLINFLKPCTTPKGEQGFVKGSPWTAMGFPCTRGNGRIDKRGSDNTPNVIYFLLQTSCPMEPGNAEEAEKIVRQRLRMPDDSHVIAYYPLSIQYWEFSQYPERDTGLSPTLYSSPGLTQGWQRFINKNEPIRVRLYGRENAWERGKVLFEVDAQILPDGRSSFKLQVLQAKALSPEERAIVQARCDELRPKKNCGEIFAE